MAGNESSSRPLVLGIDGGNSKADVALASVDGNLLSAVRGGTISHQVVGVEAGMERLRKLTHDAAAKAGASLPVDLAVATVAGADYPEDVRMLRSGIRRVNVAREVIVVNDTLGALRAGASNGWGVALICGQGINAAAASPNGRQARFPGVGDIAGDWGGGGGIGMAALQAAVRGADGRGPHTSLEAAVPEFFGVQSPAALTRELYFERIPAPRINFLAPLVFDVAAAGDVVARGIIDHLADELTGMAAALISRLRLSRLEVEIVLAGGVFRTREPLFYERLYSGILAAAPGARFVRLDSPPVAGALLLALDELARRGARDPVTPAEAAALRSSLADWDQSASATDLSE